MTFRARLSRSCLHQSDVVERQSTLLEQFADGRGGADTHDGGLYASDSVADKAGQGRQTVLLDSRLGGQHHGTGAVTDTLRPQATLVKTAGLVSKCYEDNT